MNPKDKVNHDNKASNSANLNGFLLDAFDKIIWKI
uniref:Uncharacterized protein n=1 Tax=Arundo donax TaxID=35708 RepID=A0A0A9GZZ7_ARUDO